VQDQGSDVPAASSPWRPLPGGTFGGCRRLPGRDLPHTWRSALGRRHRFWGQPPTGGI